MVSDYDSDDYELLPHEEIEHLREEVSHLRKNPFKDRAEPVDLQSSVDKLTLAITHLTKILSSTNDEMLEDFKKTSIQENFNIISSQNEKIAEGILTVAQLIQAPSTSVPAASSNVDSTVVDNSIPSQPSVDSSVSSDVSSISPTPAQASSVPLPSSGQVPPVPAASVPAAPSVPSPAANSTGMPMPPPVQGQVSSSIPSPGQVPPPLPGGMNLPPPPKKSGFKFFKK